MPRPYPVHSCSFRLLLVSWSVNRIFWLPSNWAAPPLTWSLAPGAVVPTPMPTLPLLATVRRQALLFHRPIWLVEWPPTKRSSATQRPPSLLFDRRRPLTTRSTAVPPPPATCNLAPGVAMPTPTLPLAWRNSEAPARTVLSTSMPRPMAVLYQSEPCAVRIARTPRLMLLLTVRPMLLSASSLPAAAPSAPAEVRSTALCAVPAISVAPDWTTLSRAEGAVVPTPTLPPSRVIVCSPPTLSAAPNCVPKFQT